MDNCLPLSDKSDYNFLLCFPVLPIPDQQARRGQALVLWTATEHREVGPGDQKWTGDWTAEASRIPHQY